MLVTVEVVVEAAAAAGARFLSLLPVFMMKGKVLESSGIIDADAETNKVQFMSPFNKILGQNRSCGLSQ